MTTINSVPRGETDTGTPQVRFDEGEVASAKPGRGSRLYLKTILSAWRVGRVAAAVLLCVPAISVSAAVVYLDPTAGNDENAGLTETAPVKTFAQAKVLAQGGTVYLMSALVPTADTTYDLDGGTMKRWYVSADGKVTNQSNFVTCTANILLTFTNITLDGGFPELATAGYLVAASSASVILNAGAHLKNSKCLTDAAQTSGILCANLTMTGDASISHCNLNNNNTLSAAGAYVTNLLRMEDTASICFNTNDCKYNSSIASQRVNGGARVGQLEMSGSAMIADNWSRARSYGSANANGAGGAGIFGSGISILQDQARVCHNNAYYLKGGGIYFSGTLVAKNSATIVSNSVVAHAGTGLLDGSGIYGSTLVLSNQACVVYNGWEISGSRVDPGEGSVNVSQLFMYDDAQIVSNKARTIGGAVVSNGGGMWGRARIACNDAYEIGAYSANSGLLVTGGEFTMNEDARIEENKHVGSLLSVNGGVGVQGTGRFIMNSGTIRNNAGGLIVSACDHRGYAEVRGGFVTNNTLYGVKNGSLPYSTKQKSGGTFVLNGGRIGENVGYGLIDQSGSLTTNVLSGGVVGGNSSGGAYYRTVGSLYFVKGNPVFEDPLTLTSTNQRLTVCGRLTKGARLLVKLRAFDSQGKETESLTAANDYGLDMLQDQSLEPLVAAVPDGENVTDISGYAKYFELANVLPTGIKRYMNAVKGTKIGLSDRKPSSGLIVLLATILLFPLRPRKGRSR